jgi:hypothetical protein
MKKLLGLNRWTVIGAAIGFSVATVLFVTYKQHRAAEKYKAHREEYCSSIPATAEQKKTCKEEGASARDYLPWGYELIRWPEGITTWAIIATGFVIGWQSWETRNAARAANLNAQAVINAERALVLIETEKVTSTDRASKGHSVFKIVAKNYGRTPARIISYGEPFQGCISSINGLAIPPVYPDSSQGLEQFLAPDKSHEIAVFEPTSVANVSARLAASMNQNTSFEDQELVIYGEVTYFDGISPETRVSRYCYRFEREPFTNIGGSVLSYGPREYSLHT